MAPNDDGEESRPPGPEGSGVASKPGGRVRGAPPRQRPARVRAARTRPAAADGAAEERRPRAREAAVDPSQKRKVVLLSVLTIVVLAVAVGAFVIGQGAKDPRTSVSSNAGPTTTVAGDSALATSPGPTLPDSAFTEFRDDETGFSMKYPKDWVKLNSPVREMRLVAATPNRQDYVSVRVGYTETPTNTQNLANLEAVTRGSIGQNESVKILDNKALTVNGLIGYYYLYTFTDKTSGLQGVHAHYFLYQGRKMNMIVFQALPAERFQDLKGVFDQMLLSFHSDPEPPQDTAPPPAPEASTPPAPPPS